MAEKQCKYYKEGASSSQGRCPFGNKCFYKHQLPDGSIDPGEEPHSRRKPFLADFIFDNSESSGGEDDDVMLRLEDEEYSTYRNLLRLLRELASSR
ncbi:hypothetical protein KIN20_021056 [Parelaphostrongylus tenuis]|uniref:C3H1-type domain-containing protein n=1 Tax=Parelaphostrongylus tenuis TaxID=148309 RepID=A0AAD5MNL7_PARTN|nr:hypothetical protein KIN20_021056 [Parelaphostrongylus tenuis]